jgi:hypothetical protein
MPAAARLGDPDSSNGSISGAVVSVVTINGQPAAVVGSMDSDHAPYGRPHRPHVPNPITSGSGVVTIGGKPAARVGDPFACGHTVSSGSPNVTIG